MWKLVKHEGNGEVLENYKDDGNRCGAYLYGWYKESHFIGAQIPKQKNKIAFINFFLPMCPTSEVSCSVCPRIYSKVYP